MWSRIVQLMPWFLIVACGATPAPEPVAATPVEPVRLQAVNARGEASVEATVGEAGGVLSLANGARFEIPEGVFQEPTEVRFSTGADGQAFGYAETQRPLGPMLSIEPAISPRGGTGLRVSVPMMALPDGFETADLAFAMEEVSRDARAIDTLATQTRWNNYPVRVEDGRFVAVVGGLPGHRLQFGVAR